MFHGRENPNSHPLVPPLVALVCPHCGGELICVHPLAKDGYTDLPSGWFHRTAEDALFQANCTHCHFSRKELTYFDLAKIGNLYYQAQVGYTNFWAWNREHLTLIIDYLGGVNTETHKWKNYRRFILGTWKRKSRRGSFIKAGQRLLSKPSRSL